MNLRRTLALLVCAALCAATHARAQGIPRGIWLGAMADSIRFVLQLDGQGAGNVGSYCYLNYGQRIYLSGELGRDGRFVLREYMGETEKVTARFEGRLDAADASMRGTWSSADGRKSFAFIAAKIGVLDSVGDQRRLGKTLGSFSAVFPRFDPRPGLAVERLNDTIRALVEARRRWTLESMSEYADADSADVSGEPEYRMGNITTITVNYLGNGLVVLEDDEEYDGGAHPAYAYGNHNYEVGPTVVREIPPGSLFKSTSGYRAAMGKLIFAELSRGAYPCKEEVGLASVNDEATVLSYAIAGRGLVYRLAPGPHACGPAPDIFIPYTKVRSLLAGWLPVDAMRGTAK